MLLDVKIFKQADYISGGERRDWFFSILISIISKKPHLFLTKDKQVYDQHGKQVKDIRCGSVFHIADLITLGSSYIDKWIPAVESVRGFIGGTATVVDRCQGGKVTLDKHCILCESTVHINEEFFNTACEKGYITQAQRDVCVNFLNNQKDWTPNFIRENPEFLSDSLNSEDIRIKERANKFVKDYMEGKEF